MVKKMVIDGTLNKDKGLTLYKSLESGRFASEIFEK